MKTKTAIRKMPVTEIISEIRKINPRAEIGRSDLYYKNDLVNLLYRLRNK